MQDPYREGKTTAVVIGAICMFAGRALAIDSDVLTRPAQKTCDDETACLLGKF